MNIGGKGGGGEGKGGNNKGMMMDAKDSVYFVDPGPGHEYFFRIY